MQEKFWKEASAIAEQEILAYQVRPTPRPHTLWLEWINRVDEGSSSQPELHALLEDYAKTKAESELTLSKGAELLERLSRVQDEFKVLPAVSLSSDREDLRVSWTPAERKGGPINGARFLLSFLLFLTLQETGGHPPRIKVCQYCGGFFLDTSRAYSAKHGDTCHLLAKKQARQKRGPEKALSRATAKKG